MDASDDARILAASEQRIFDVNLQGRMLAFDVCQLALTQPETFARLVEAVSKGDRTLSHAILRSWGIR